MTELLFELRWRQVLQAALRPGLVVVLAPGLDDDLGFAARAEPFDGQALVAELAVEALVGAVLPGLARVVEHGRDALTGDPLQDGLADEFRPVVRAHEQRRSMHAWYCRYSASASFIASLGSEVFSDLRMSGAG